MKIRLNSKTTFSTINILIILSIVNLLFLGGLVSYVNYSNQVRQQYATDTNNTTAEIKRLINSINISDEMKEKRTEFLLERAVNNSIINYIALVNSTNQTNILVKFLSDNFGAQSGYLERENFQYGRANQTFEMIQQILNQTR